MPEHITGEAHQDAARGAVAGHAQGPASAGDDDRADADAEITMVDGEWSIKVRTRKTILQPSQSDGQEAGVGGAATTAVADDKEVSMTFKGSLRIKEDQSPEAQRGRWFREMRGWLMVLATVAASGSYQAGLNPPGGFWQDSPADGSHRAADPALRDERRSRYLLFYYFNSTAFVTSLVIMVLLMSERFYHKQPKVVALMFTTFVDLASLIGAYIAGSTRYFSSCIYVIVITCVAFVGVICMGEVMSDICIFFLIRFRCMETLARKNWCPIPKEVVEEAQKKKQELEQSKSRRKKQHRTCCLCCA